MATSYQVRVWALGTNAAGNPVVRWKVAGKERSRSFTTVGLADSFRSELVTAANAGSAFDIDSGLPVTMRDGTGPTWFEHATAYVLMKWPNLAPNSRTSTAESLATVTPALSRNRRGQPEDATLRKALYGWAFNPGRHELEPPEDVERALGWIRRAALPVSALADDLDLVRAALDRLGRTADGQRAAANTFRRKRAVFYNALRYAVEKKRLPFNPLDVVQWRLPPVEHEIDRRVVATPAQVEALLDAVAAQGERGQHLRACFATMYYAAARPSEAIAVRRRGCELPATGWGALHLTGSAPYVGSAWTDTGENYDPRELKYRARHAVRRVPIPPRFVRELRAHLDRYGTADDGRLFRAARGGFVNSGETGPHWGRARREALTPDQAASPLAARPYDLRHAGVSFWLRAGVDATEVARRAGHSVNVLLQIYAGVLDGTETEANQRIERALSEMDDTNRE